MRIWSLLLIILAALTGTLVCAQEVSTDPIDVQLDKCLQDTTGETIPGSRHCCVLAYYAWDAEMNKVFQDLMNALSPEGQKSLRSAQRAWLNYRDAQLNLNNQLYTIELRGSMYHVMEANANMELVKQRVVELRLEYGDLILGK